ncbi:MAG: hypothetical protein KGL39_10360 [Patescibacteria group bacterium]|nr:hypothetical protein [Patescibacteria group bacterium]
MFANRTIRGVKIPCVALYIVVVMFIIAYGYYLRRTGTRDILETKIIDHPSCSNFDGWATTHFIFFLILGVLYPGHPIQCIAVSLGWEGIEHLLGTTNIELSGSRLQLIGDQDEDGRPIAPKKGDAPKYWYGRFVTDNSFNLTGYMIGWAIADRWWPNRG